MVFNWLRNYSDDDGGCGGISIRGDICYFFISYDDNDDDDDYEISVEGYQYEEISANGTACT